MTIAKRLVLLLAVPLLALVGLGVFTRLQLTTIETRSRFVADQQVPSLAALGNISRTFAELRVQVRNHVLATSEAERVSVRATFERNEAELARLLDQYERNLTSDDQDRRLLNDYRNQYRDWLGRVKQLMLLTGRGSQRGAARTGAPGPGRAAEQSFRRVDSAQRGPRARREPDCGRLHHRCAMADTGRELRGDPVDGPAGVSHVSADREADSGP